MEIKDIETILLQTGRKNIQHVVAELKKLGFFKAPASIRYQNNYEGGLAEHSLAVYESAMKLRAQQLAEDPGLQQQLPEDSVALVTLLHDVCKSDVYTKEADGSYTKSYEGFPCGHGEKSVIMLLRMGLELTDDEILAIRWHMGDHEAKVGSQEYKCLQTAEKNCALLRLLQKSDSMAAASAMNQQSTAPELTWDPVLWSDQFRIASRTRNTDKLHSLRSQIYTTTREAVARKGYITSSGNTVKLELNPDIQRQTVFCEKEIAPLHPNSQYDTIIEVKGVDCLDLAYELVLQEGSDSVAVLNLASWRNPGGGVMKGAGAQEEYLFRCTDYFRSLYQYVDYASLYNIARNPHHSYPLNERFGAIFSRGVTVLRGKEAEGYPFLDSPWKVNFIAVAAHRNPPVETVHGESRLVSSEVSFMEEKVRTILRVALRNGQTTLVLGALGCGAFHNPPKHVAEIFKSVIEESEFTGVFKAIYFAIIDDHNSNGNLAAFREVFK